MKCWGGNTSGEPRRWNNRRFAACRRLVPAWLGSPRYRLAMSTRACCSPTAACSAAERTTRDRWATGQRLRQSRFTSISGLTAVAQISLGGAHSGARMPRWIAEVLGGATAVEGLGMEPRLPSEARPRQCLDSGQLARRTAGRAAQVGPMAGFDAGKAGADGSASGGSGRGDAGVDRGGWRNGRGIGQGRRLRRCRRACHRCGDGPAVDADGGYADGGGESDGVRRCATTSISAWHRSSRQPFWLQPTNRCQVAVLFLTGCITSPGRSSTRTTRHQPLCRCKRIMVASCPAGQCTIQIAKQTRIGCRTTPHALGAVPRG